jgi:hypothetical protein
VSKEHIYRSSSVYPWASHGSAIPAFTLTITKLSRSILSKYVVLPHANVCLQAVNGFARIESIFVTLIRQQLFRKTHHYNPFSISGFIQIYFLHPLVLGSAVLKFGAWQAFLPNLASSVVMVFMQVSTNNRYCNSLGSAQLLGAGLLSKFPRALDVLTSSFFSPGIAPWFLDDTPSCSRTIAALQVGF